MNMLLAQIITDSKPATEAIKVSFLDKIALGAIYWLLGIAAAFSIGVAIGGLVGICRSVGFIFKSRTAWLSVIFFLVIGYLGLFFAWSTLPIAGNLGDSTGYKMQSMVLVGCVFPGLFTWIFTIGMLGMGSKKLAMSESFRSYAFVFGFLIYYVCGFLGLFMVLNYLTSALSLKMVALSLLAYPITFFVAPLVMLFKYGIWLPIVLHFGGLLGSGFVMSLGEDK